MVQNNSKEKLDQMLEGQVNKKVEYRDVDGHKQIKNVTYQDAGIETATTLMDLTRGADGVSDWPEILDIVMKDILVNPNWNFEQLDKGLDKKYKTKTIKHKNKIGQEVNINFKFPGFRNAFDIAMSGSRVNGQLNLTETLQRLNQQVIVNDQGEQVNMDFWNNGGHATGLGMFALNEAQKYLKETLSIDGVFDVLMDSFRWIQKTVSIDSI